MAQAPVNSANARLELLPLVKGLLTFVPMVSRALHAWRSRNGAAEGEQYWNPSSAGYSYGQWAKHLTVLHHLGMELPVAMAEVGPGDSLGLGIAALLSGVRAYHAFDVAPFAVPKRDEAMVGEIAQRIDARQPVPANGWPVLKDLIGTDEFPVAAVGPRTAEPDVEAIRQAVRERTGPVRYVAPWPEDYEPGMRYDLIVSHSVLEYVEDPERFFTRLAGMLAPGGWMAHQIDLGSLRITRAWNGHLAYSPWLWKLVAGRRAHVPNRVLPTGYRTALERCGFEIVLWTQLQKHNGLARSSLAPQFRAASDTDVTCYALYIVARRRRS